MKSNEEYLDELLNAMSEEDKAQDNISGPMDQAMIDALLAAAGNGSTTDDKNIEDKDETLNNVETAEYEETLIVEDLLKSEVFENDSIDTQLLEKNSNVNMDIPETLSEGITEESNIVDMETMEAFSEEIAEEGNSVDMDILETLSEEITEESNIVDMDAMEAFSEEIAEESNIEDMDTNETFSGEIAEEGNSVDMDILETLPEEITEESDIVDMDTMEAFSEEVAEYSSMDMGTFDTQFEEVSVENENSEKIGSESMLNQLMEEMKDDSVEEIPSSYEEETITEEGIEALLNAAKTSGSEMEQEVNSFESRPASEIDEIEALLGMSDNGEVLDENMALLQMLEEAGGFTEELDSMDGAKEMGVSELDSLLAKESSEITNRTDEIDTMSENEGAIGKKSGGVKAFFGKILSALVEEVPEEEVAESDSINLSKENKDILKQLDKETAKKIKANDKKEAKEQKKQAKKAKKEEKQKKALEKKAGKLMKEKNIATSEASVKKEKKLPKKKVKITFAFAFSVLVAILIVEWFVPSILSVEKARSAYDKGEYLEAYKEYYGQKLSEADEKKFQAATVILRMQRNLDGYNNYMKMNKEVYAIHSLLEAVHIRDDAFLKAQEFDVLSQVSKIYNEVLELLNSKYGLTEESAMEIVKEESDVTYTKTLEALAGGQEYEESKDKESSHEDLLPEEEGLFLNVE